MTDQEKILLDSANAFLLCVHLLIQSYEAAQRGSLGLISIKDDADIANAELADKTIRLQASLNVALECVTLVANSLKDVLCKKMGTDVPAPDIEPFIRALNGNNKPGS